MARILEAVFANILLCACALAIPGCLPKKDSQAAVSKTAAFSLQDLQTNIDIPKSIAHDTEFEAKLIDIPSMIGSVIIDHDSIEHDDTLNYSLASCQEQQAVIDFYLQEMECNGWQRISVMQGIESLLLFEKPHKICAISIRPLSNKSHPYQTFIHIMVNPKEE